MQRLPRFPLFLRGLLFVLSAALVAVFVQAAMERPWLLLFALVLLVVRQTQPFLARRRLKQLLDSGDVARLLAALEGLPSPDERGRGAERLMRATALASYGWTTRARQLLEFNTDTAAADALEHRVFLEVLLAALDGDNGRALQMAYALSDLPLPEARAIRARTKTHRAGALALARAFAQCSERGDDARLRDAVRQNPLLRWPMRYAQAHISLQKGDPRQVKRLLKKAPHWPEQSVFRRLSRDLQQSMG